MTDRAPLAVASFWVHRPEEFPEPRADYPAMLRILQRSCERLNLRHVVLTDLRTVTERCDDLAGIRAFVGENIPSPLMQATTELHAQFLSAPIIDDVLFVGADTIVLKDPRLFFPADADLCVTLRPGHSRYPINNGAQYVRNHARERVAAVYRRMADMTGKNWGDDQRALQDVLAPMPKNWGEYERAGLKVRFLPMSGFNDVPATPNDRVRHAVLLHFRGRRHKPKFFPWAKRWGFDR